MKLSYIKQAVLVLLTVALRGWSQDMPADMPRVTVNIYNDAGVAEPILAQGRREATRIFQRAGVKIMWVDCSRPEGESMGRSTCQTPMNRSHLAVRIVPWSSKSSDVVFGDAFLSSDGEGTYSDVFYDSVTKHHEEWHVCIPVLLGHVIAHEIGHLLLGANAHSWMGIMRSQWQGEELQSIAMGRLLFTPAQVESLKDRLSASPR
jgi:hypothetical protein